MIAELMEMHFADSGQEERRTGMLEKILEEIEKQKGNETNYTTQEDKRLVRHWNNCIDVVADIIRSHMDEDRWIPVEERLPNEEEFKEAYRRNEHAAEFMVTIKGANRPTTLYYTRGWGWRDENYAHYEIIAWRPLPEAYRAKED